MDFLEKIGYTDYVNVYANVFLIIVKGLSEVNPHFIKPFQSLAGSWE